MGKSENYGFLARLHEVHRAIAVTPVVHVPVPVRVRVRVTLALKFSRSPYLDNHSSESIHNRYPVGLAFIPWHRAPGSRPGGWGWRLKSRTPSKMAILVLKFSRSPYLDNHSSESIDTWAFDTL